MFGFRSAVPSRAHRSLLAAENALAAQSIGHPDGWGIGWFVDDDAYVLKTAKAAHACERFQRTCERLASHTFVVHVRRATVGEIDPVNAHPFRFGRWLFAHNGTLLDFAPKLHAQFQPVGSTDSELAFCWIMQELAKSHAGMPQIDELTLTLRELAAQLAERGTFNFLLGNGLALWAHASTQLHYVERSHPFAHAQLRDEDLSIDFSQHNHPGDKIAVVVTAPLTTNEDWQAFAPHTLKVFVDGQAI